MTTVDILDEAIAEAERVRARHDGVHCLHSYVCTLMLLRDCASSYRWEAREEAWFEETMQSIRQINRCGFCTVRSGPFESPKDRQVASVAAEVTDRF